MLYGAASFPIGMPEWYRATGNNFAKSQPNAVNCPCSRVTIWSAEGVDMSMLSVFDGIHLFSAAYWGIQHGDITAVEQGFRNEITAYNNANHMQKIWAAGVFPGFNDTKVPGRSGTFIVDRNNGQTYQESWGGAMASSPDWITITSFNEWFEGSMIEPSVTYGNQYLSLTQQYAKAWHG